MEVKIVRQNMGWDVKLFGLQLLNSGDQKPALILLLLQVGELPLLYNSNNLGFRVAYLPPEQGLLPYSFPLFLFLITLLSHCLEIT